MRLQHRILSLLIPALLLSALALGWIAHRQLMSSAELRTASEMRTLLNQVRGEFANHLRTARNNARLFGSSATMRRYIQTADEGIRFELLQPPLLELFDTYQKAYPEYYELRALLPDGYEDTRITSRDIDNATEEEDGSAFFDALEEAPDGEHAVVQLNPDNGELALLVGRAMLWRNATEAPVLAAEKLHGYMAITMSLNFLDQLVRQGRIGSSGFLLMTDDAGAVPLGGHHGTTINAGNAWTPAADGDIQVSEHLLIDGADHLAQRVHLANGLHVVAALPWHELRAASRGLAIGVAAATLAAAVMTVVLVSFLLRRAVVAPIQALEHATKRVREGDLDATIDVDRDDEVGQLARAFRDMTGSLAQQRTALNAQQKVLRRTAYYDNLTGLPNRAMFRRQLGEALQLAARHNYTVGLMFIDLDGFKRVNDTLGHDAGDDLLKEIARRLRACLRSSDTIACGVASSSFVEVGDDGQDELVSRLGGDEFTILLNHLSSRRSAASVAAKVLAALNPPVFIKDQDVVTTPSIGIAVYPEDGTDADSLLRSADTAMYQAKRLGKNRFDFYESSMGDAARRRLTVERRLRIALDTDRLEIHYMPLVDAKDGSPRAVEALLRWTDDELGIVPPDVFIEVAEDVGLIVPLGGWVLSRACRQLAAWRAEGLTGITLCVNVSSVQFEQEGFVQSIATTLQQAHCPAHRLELEVTERTAMTDTSNTLQVLRELNSLRIGIALDDFGTGHSSLAYLKRFPLTRIKIDKSFVDGIDTDPEDAAIVRTMVAMAKTLNLSVVAEGVETKAQRVMLANLGVDLIQGWLESPAMPPEQCRAWIVERMSVYG